MEFTQSHMIIVVSFSLFFLLVLKLLLSYIKFKSEKDLKRNSSTDSSALSLSDDIKRKKVPAKVPVIPLKKRPIDKQINDAVSENIKHLQTKEDNSDYSEESESDNILDNDTASIHSCKLKSMRSQNLFGISNKNNKSKKPFVKLEETQDTIVIKKDEETKDLSKVDKFAFREFNNDKILGISTTNKFVSLQEKVNPYEIKPENTNQKDEKFVSFKQSELNCDIKTEFNTINTGLRSRKYKNKSGYKTNALAKKSDDIFFDLFNSFADPSQKLKKKKKANKIVDKALEKSVRLQTTK